MAAYIANTAQTSHGKRIEKRKIIKLEKARVIREAMTRMHKDPVDKAAQSLEKLWKLASSAKTRCSVLPA